jgi:signal transduction histidine kinase/ActR/RegA family two-component response regulator
MKPDEVSSAAEQNVGAGARLSALRDTDIIPHKSLSLSALAGDVIVAVLASGGAVFIQWLLDPWVGERFPFAVLFCANAIAAWYGGYGSGLLAAALGYLGVDYLFISRGSLPPDTPLHYIALALYSVSSLIIIGFAGSVRPARRRVDATNRRLHERVEELETLLNLLPVGVWIGNARCDRMIGNRAAYEILGLPLGINASMTSPQASEPPLVDLKFMMDGKEVRPEELPMHRVARTSVACHNVQYDVIRADGETRSVYGSAAPLFDARGNVRAVIGAHTDITKRKQIETALRQADQRKDEFLATLAHELRNPLSPIRTAAAILRKKAQPDPDLERITAVVDRQVQQMARLLDDLLDVSRITLNRLALRTERVALSDILESAIETSRPLIDEAGHELLVGLPHKPAHVEADGMRLAQVFSNLLNNAAKYTDRGGRITVSCDVTESDVLVHVEDSGIGIAPDRLSQVFEMFSQEHPALQRSHNGLGLGLALARALVQMHGGSIEAYSAGLGMGSRFTVRLPITQQPKGMPVRSIPPSSDTPARVSRRVLIVEDKHDAAEALAMYLSLLGHQVRVAHDGVEALEASAAFLPDIILLDIGLPRMDGFEVAQAIRGQPWGADVLLVAVSGWGQADDKRRAVQAGFDQHLTKPIDPQAVAEILSQARARRASMRQEL